MAEINPKANVLLTRDDDNVEWAFDEISDLIGRTTQQKKAMRISLSLCIATRFLAILPFRDIRCSSTRMILL